jgi:hypothetical protein
MSHRYSTCSMVVLQFIKFSLFWVNQSFTGFASTLIVGLLENVEGMFLTT